MRLSLLLTLIFAAAIYADGPQDNLAEKVRPVPPPGVAVPADVKQELQTGLDVLAKEIEQLRSTLKTKPALLDLLPDVQIFHRAVESALKYDEFYNVKEFASAKKLLQLGGERAKSMREGQAPWLTASGPTVRGYISKIDGSVQPYGLVIPASYKVGSGSQHRLDLWFHGRGETLTELSFLSGRLGSVGEFAPAGAFVLHPYGRYCNANHFAGEIDSFEGIDSIRKVFPIDMNRIVVRGFSMGGAACWNFAVHYSGLWAAAAPGAGFSETPDFLKVFQNEIVQPTWYEKKLFHLYDCNDWAINLVQCPTVAYSGEKDKQKQAADIMVKALEAEKIKLVHIIGPDTGHSYHPQAKVEINRRIDAITQVGRPTLPHTLNFVTYTLRYSKMRWLTIDRMTQHWTPARINAEISSGFKSNVRIKTEGVEAFSISMAPGTSPFNPSRGVSVSIDDDVVPAGLMPSDRSWDISFAKTGKTWAVATPTKDLAKRPHLQGPIDDAFMDRFIMVRPTGQPLNEKTGKWVAQEMNHAVTHWRKQFRGEAPVKDDDKITDADIASSNLILWGDPTSNAILKKIADKLPIAWSTGGIQLGKDGKTFAPANHVLTMIYPNPLNPNKYVVLNSGFTFREYDYLNNARQIPKLPDWVVFDVDQPTTARRAAGIADAAFFGERWEYTGERK